MTEELVDVMTKDAGMNMPDFVSFDLSDEDTDLQDEIKISEIDINDSQNESNFDATRVYLNELGKSQLLTAD